MSREVLTVAVVATERTRRALDRDAARMAQSMRGRLLGDVLRFSADAGISVTELAAASGVARSYLNRILAGDARPTIETYARLGAVLGADLSGHLYPNTGPIVRDRHQARILESLLAIVHPRWRPSTEVAVRKPSRGWIDVVLHDPREQVVVATEIQSELRRLEQLVRWAAEKADSLPSWPGWPGLGLEPDAVSRLLLVRRTRANRTTAAEFAQQLRLAYPAHPDDAIAALTETATRWPGPALVWVATEGRGVRLVPGR